MPQIKAIEHKDESFLMTETLTLASTPIRA